MKSKLFIFGCSLIAVLGCLCGCRLPDRTGVAILMIADGAFDDESFNASCKEGLERAVKEFGVTAAYQVVDNMTTVAVDDYDLIIANGFLLADAVETIAGRNPSARFALIDYAYDAVPANVHCVVFASDEVSFPLGYLAAAWAAMQDPDNASVAYVGGMDIPPVRQWTTPFCSGAAYYNSMHETAVACGGEFVGDFYDVAAGKALASSLIGGGADVILGCGGQAGNASLEQAKAMGAWGIGVDWDMYEVLPAVGDILLCSGIKRFDNGVYAVVKSLVEDRFDGGGTYQGNLENGGIMLAPYHDFENEIPAAVQSDIDDIIADIQSGIITTGWE
ncbi:BMP family ABC transporter substrate-binding protein [Thermodesulfobacteriota bacterium]